MRFSLHVLFQTNKEAQIHGAMTRLPISTVHNDKIKIVTTTVLLLLEEKIREENVTFIHPLISQQGITA